MAAFAAIRDAPAAKSDDWMCPKCHDMQFGRNTHCRKCGCVRPTNASVTTLAVAGDHDPTRLIAAALKTDDAPKKQSVDWRCPVCQEVVYGGRPICRSCGCALPTGMVEGGADGIKSYVEGVTGASTLRGTSFGGTYVGHVDQSKGVKSSWHRMWDGCRDDIFGGQSVQHNGALVGAFSPIAPLPPGVRPEQVQSASSSSSSSSSSSGNSSSDSEASKKAHDSAKATGAPPEAVGARGGSRSRSRSNKRVANTSSPVEPVQAATTEWQVLQQRIGKRKKKGMTVEEEVEKRRIQRERRANRIVALDE